jgi:hypothetical protein
MTTTPVNRLILDDHFPATLALGQTRQFTVGGRLEFPKTEVPLVKGDGKGRPLGAPSAMVKVSDVRYVGDKTQGDYTVESVLYAAGSVVDVRHFRKSNC